jgi:hypothetical protein
VADKLGYSFEVLVAEPSNWLLALGALAVLALLLHARSFVALLPLLAALALFVGALLPTPTWLQYFYAPYAVLAAAFALGTVYLARTRWRWWGVGLFALVAAVSVGFGAPRYLALGDLLAMGDWKPDMVSRVSGEIREVVSGGTVVTLSPIYPLQAGLDIYPGLASGPFGFRVADVLSPEERERHGLISVEEVLRMMSAQHPEAILTGAEGVLEYPLAYFATEYGYEQVELSNNLSLWVRPDKR